MDQTTAEKMRQMLAKIERLESEKQELSDDINEVYGEAKAFGLDVPVLRRLVQNRRKDPEKLSEFEALLDLYESAVT